MECYHCAAIHPELTGVLPEFTAGLAAQYYVGHGALFAPGASGFTVDGSGGFATLPEITPDQDRRYFAVTVRPQVFINLVADHVIVHRMFPLAPDRTTVFCDWLFAPEVVGSGQDVSSSVELFDRVNRQDFEACERTQLSMSSRAYRHGGVLVPSEHHIAEFHAWVARHVPVSGTEHRAAERGLPQVSVAGRWPASGWPTARGLLAGRMLTWIACHSRGDHRRWLPAAGPYGLVAATRAGARHLAQR